MYFKNAHIMLVVSASCMAECKYCFGPHKGKVASIDTINNSISYLNQVFSETGQFHANITFHGGEPLFAPYSLWEYMFEQLKTRLIKLKLELCVQSNLWNLNDDFCRLFRKHKVAIGTSLDGPEVINDRQRGSGYFEKTFNGIKLATDYGFDPACITTFTPLGIERWKEVFDFFINEKISFSIHPSLKPLNYKGNDNLFINTDQYSRLVNEMLPVYIKNRKLLRIGSFDQLIRSVAFGKGDVCTFRDCFGMFLVIGSDGEIYPCQRFCGIKDFALGNVADMPTLFDIENHPNAIKIIERQKEVAKRCAFCKHYNYCKGGCYYNALSAGDAVIDHYCNTYKEAFESIRNVLLKEISDERNIMAMKSSSMPKNGETPFLKKGKLISLTKKAHPSTIAQHAKRAIALYEIAKGPTLAIAAQRMVNDNITENHGQTYSALKQIKETMLGNGSLVSLNNLYLHLTFKCNLNCSHCYADANPDNSEYFMASNELAHLIKQAIQNNFRQVVLTGGEPLIHPQINEILIQLNSLKNKKINFVLRTNFTGEYSDDFLLQIASSFDQVVVSVDGNKKTHDERRGKGTYQVMKNNLIEYQRLVKINKKNFAEVSLACVMDKKDILEKPGNAVRELANSLGISRIRFRPLLPIGRAKSWDKPPTSQSINAHLDPMEMIEKGIWPIMSCGLGQNLYVEPSGDSFPCYAYHKPHSMLSNVINDGLNHALQSNKFQNLRHYNVDHIEKCRNCEYRYLCGGACRAWSGEVAQYRLDAPPLECYGLKERAKEIVDTARKYLLDDNM
jgi:uncharacterized protein